MLSFLALSLAPAALAQLPDETDLAARYGERLSMEARVYRSAAPGVVSIDVEADLWTWDLFRGRRIRTGRKSVGQGTGVVIDPAGLVITNAHVAVPLEEGIDPDSVLCRVSFPEEFGGETLPTRILNLDREWDLALLKIEAPAGRRFQAVPLGDSGDLLPGERVVAIGTPFGNSHSVTSGILSAVHRDVTLPGPDGRPRTFAGLLQTDAAINPGNSGGPLLNVYGEVIGINNATLLGADGIGYAIPVNRVREILDDRLLDADRSGRFWAGMRVEGGGQGLVVRSLHPRGPAARAGLRVGDRILAVDGVPVDSETAYATQLLPHQAGDQVALRVERDGHRLELRLELLPAEARDTYGLLGFEAVPETLYYGRGFARRRLQVLRVTRVFEGTGAAELGLRPGDLILAVALDRGDRSDPWVPVRTVGELVALIRGPDFRRQGENVWILRDEESYRGHLSFDDPDL